MPDIDALDAAQRWLDEVTTRGYPPPSIAIGIVEPLIEAGRALQAERDALRAARADGLNVIAAQSIRLEQLDLVAAHARALLEGGGDEAVHHLTRALDALTPPPETED